MDLLVMLPIMLLFLLLKGFFSGSEIALVSSDKIKLRHKARQGKKGAQMVLKLFKTPDVLLGTTLVGTNVATVALTTIGAIMMIDAFGERGDFYAFLIFTPLLLIFGEIVPKSIYQQRSDDIAPIIVYPLRVASIILYPVIFIFSRVARLAVRIIGGKRKEQNVFITREQLRTILDMSERSSEVDDFDKVRIRRIIRFADTFVGETMIPVAEITTVSRQHSTEEAILLVRRRGYNRLPVYEGNVSNVVGAVTLTTWDLLDKDITHRPLEELIKPVLYVSPLQTIDRLLPILQKRQDHMAIVVDEFGSAIGMITIEDILEEVVGEIDVGYDFEEYLPKRKRHFEQLGEEIYLMDSRIPISEANDILGIHLPTTDAHTIGGLILARLRHIPSKGEFISESGYRFTAVEVTERAILKVRVEQDL